MFKVLLWHSHYEFAEFIHQTDQLGPQVCLNMHLYVHIHHHHFIIVHSHKIITITSTNKVRVYYGSGTVVQTVSQRTHLIGKQTSHQNDSIT